MQPQNLFNRMRSRGIAKSTLEEYQTFVYLKKLTTTPDAATLVCRDAKTDGWIVATELSSIQLLAWPDWYNRVCSIDYNPGGFPICYHQDGFEGVVRINPIKSKIADADLPAKPRTANATGLSRNIDGAEVWRLYMLGYDSQKIAEMYNVTRPAITYHIKQQEKKRLTSGE